MKRNDRKHSQLTWTGRFLYASSKNLSSDWQKTPIYVQRWNWRKRCASTCKKCRAAHCHAVLRWRPASYGKPQKEPLVQAYPFLRAATVLTAFFFVIALGLSVFTTNQGMDAQNVADMTSMAQSAREAAPVMEAPAAEAESFGEEVAAETAAAKIVEETVMVETVVEEAAVAEEAMVEEAPQGAALSATMDAEATAVPEMEAAAALPAATVSSLPRPAATETAVPPPGRSCRIFLR
ncbi:MAG: hypothetical protein M5U34_22710 [Chloroflexi bacterium]|nr:hypothetical protein [Chloroflexota bacterium]